MTPNPDVDIILDDCFFAVGQAVSALKQIDYDAIVWWRNRYREKFLHALADAGNAWPDDRDRLMAVSRYLGQRAVHHAGEDPSIGLISADLASAEIEAGCRMKRLREAAGD